MNLVIQTLKQVELFHGMADEQLSQIAAIAETVTYPAGAVVFRQGDAGDALYLVSRGQVEVHFEREGAEGAAIYLGMGQSIGEMALVDQATRSATIIIAEDDTTLVRIPIVDFMALCAMQTAIGFILMRNIAQDLSFKLRHHDSSKSGGVKQ